MESKPYTNKQGKTLDTYLVTFDRDFSKEELSALRAKAKALKGWYDRETKGWMLRSVDDAKAFADEVMGKSEDDIADEAPLSMADFGNKLDESDFSDKSDVSDKQAETDRLIDWDEPGPEENPFLNVGVDKTVDQPKKRSKWISDEDAAEFDDLRNGLRNHLGEDPSNMVQEDTPEYGHKKSPSETRQDLTTSSSSQTDNAKLQIITENLQELAQKFAGKADKRGVFTDLANAIGAIQPSINSPSYYATIKLKGDKAAEIRISNHNANADNFAKRGSYDDNISIVIKSRRSPNTFHAHPEVELTEYVYTTEAIRADGNLLSQVAESLRQMIETGEYIDLSGKAIVNRSPEADIVREDAPSYGKPQPKQMDAEVLRMGSRMTYLMMKGGLRKFSDYAEAMVDEVGDAIRPHLKSLYAAAQNMEEVIDLGWDEEMDDRKTVKAFDVYNFDKPGAKDIIETAQHVTQEEASQQQTDKLIEQLKDDRNEKRKQKEGKKPIAPVGDESYIDMVRRVAENNMEKFLAEALDSYEERTMEIAHEYDMDQEKIGVDDVVGRLNELQSMWEDLTNTYGETPSDKRVMSVIEAIEREYGRWKHREVTISEGRSAVENVLAESADKPSSDKPASGSLFGEESLTQHQRSTGIQDWGEELWGARKNALKEIAHKLDNLTAADLVANPLSKVFKPSDWKKMVEKGEITSDDALLLEAITRLILRDGKPRELTRSSYAKRRGQEEIKHWAEVTANYIQKLQELCESQTPRERAEVIGSLDIRDMEAERAKRARMLEMNPGRIDGGLYAPSEIESMVEILRGLGYPSNGVGKAKFAKIQTNTFGTSYELRLDGKYYGSYATNEKAIEACVKIAKASRGDTDVEYSPSVFHISSSVKERRGIGRWEVRVLKGHNPETVKKDMSESEAKAYADELQKKNKKNPAMAFEQQEVVRSYSVTVKDPVGREYVALDDVSGFDNRSECEAWVTDNLELAQKKANEVVSARYQAKGKAKGVNHMQVEVSRNHIDNTYMVWQPLTKKRSSALGNMNVLAKGFKTYREAVDWVNQNRENIDKWDADRKKAWSEFAYFGPEVERVGTDYRHGRDVGEAEFGEVFGFRGVQFGNWTNQRDRQQAVNEAYDALMDMANIIGISPKAIGLNGELGIAFGARGTGKANAHYEPSEVVINLTKTRGAGSLAHEWWHALDNYFARRGGVKTGMITVNAAEVQGREAMKAAFADLVKAVQGSAYDLRSQQRGKGYWGTMEEETARLFAEWVDRRLIADGHKNGFLSRGVGEDRAERWRRNAYEAYRLMIEISNWAVERNNAKLPEGEQKALEEIMPYEQFRERDEALRGFPYPTDIEIRDLFDKPLRRLFDVIEEVAGDNGIVALNEPAAEYVKTSKSESFDRRRDKAIAEKGTVTPGLADMEVKVVDVARHQFSGESPIAQAKAWAKENIAGVHEAQRPDGSKYPYTISNKAIDKYLSQSAMGKSDNLGVHLSALTSLPEIIGESVEVEVHPDYRKGADGVRRIDNGYEKDRLIHRLYGAINIDGMTHRVKSTIIETKDNKLRAKAHSFEVTNIELLDESGSSKMEPKVSPNNMEGTLGIAKLLKGVEKSYDEGVKFLDVSENNDNFTHRYETQEGKTISYTSENPEAYGGLFDFDFRAENAAISGVNDRAGGSDLQRQDNTALYKRGDRLNESEGEFSAVERVFTETGSFNFTSGERIESADDVAFIFSALEDAAKEHTFAVYVKEGKPTVVELGMGSFNSSIADIPTASLAYSRIKPDEVYFVHNHPSGNLKCSPQDAQLLKKMQEMCDVPVHGVIINLKTGHYGTFDTSGGHGIGSKRTPESASPLTVHTLDKQIFAADYDPMMQPQVRSAEDVAAFLNSHRMGDRAKVSFLILSRANKIVGNIHTPYTNIPTDADEMARYISERVIQFGGESAILYGDFAIDHSERGTFNRLKQSLHKVGGTNLLDVVNVEGNYTRSANNEGLLYEPGSEYGASANSDIRFREVEDDPQAKWRGFKDKSPKDKLRISEYLVLERQGRLKDFNGRIACAISNDRAQIEEALTRLDYDPEEIADFIEHVETGKQAAIFDIEKGNIVIFADLHPSLRSLADSFYHECGHYFIEKYDTPAAKEELYEELVVMYPYLAEKINRNYSHRSIDEVHEEVIVEMVARMAIKAKDMPAIGQLSTNAEELFNGLIRSLGYDEEIDGRRNSEINDRAGSRDGGRSDGLDRGSRMAREASGYGSGLLEEVQRQIPKKPFDFFGGKLKDRSSELSTFKQTSTEAKSGQAEKLSKKFNTPIRIVEDESDWSDLSDYPEEMQRRMRSSKGFYNPATGEVVVVVPNNATVEDVAETVFHEVVAHKGLREIIGEENYDAFCDEVYEHLKDDLKQQIDEETTRRFMGEPGKGYEHHRRTAVDEMFGRMSEKGFEDFTKAERGIWSKLKAKVLEAINKFLGSLKLPKWVKLGDNELRYMLWRSHERLTGKGDYVDMARDMAKRQELGLGANEVFFREIDEVNNTGKLPDVGTKERTNAVRRIIESAAIRVENPGQALIIDDKKSLEDALSETGFSDDEKTYLLSNADKNGVIRGENGRELLGAHIVGTDKILIFAHAESTATIRYANYLHEELHHASSVNPLVRRAIDIVTPALEELVPDFCNEIRDNYKLDRLEEDVIKEEIVTNLLSRKLSYGGLTEIVTNLPSEVLPSFRKLLSVLGYEDEQTFEKQFRNDVAKASRLGSGSSIRQGSGQRSEKLINETKQKFHNEQDGSKIKHEYGETGDIWKDRSVGLEERITNAAIRLAQNQADDLTLLGDAMRAIGGNLTSLRRAMAAQKRFDQATVKRVSGLARILMQNGYLSGMTSGEMQRLLSAVKNSVGHKEVKESVQKIMDIMVDNQLRNGEATLRQLLAIRGSKVDARGVEVQSALDVEGQRTMEVVKKAMSLKEDDINDRIAEALNRMSDPDQTIADQAAIEYAGLQMALDYVQNIADSKAEEMTLRDSLKTAKEDRDAGRMTDDAYRQFVESVNDAIRKNKIERAEAYFNLVGRLSDSLHGSIENAKAFREAEKARVNEIHHNANSDMEGRPTNEHHRDGKIDKVMNNGIVQFLFAPLGTFDQIMRVFGNKSANGEGYLWSRFMRGWVDSRNKELSGVEEKYAILDKKAAEIFGKGTT